jgi:transposase, IS5 family
MSICESGVNCKTQATKISIDVTENHPLIKLSQALPWRDLVDLILPDLKKTKAGCWWRGRKLKVRTHLGVYLLQQLYNKTDRQMEYDVKDNAAYQIFCGHGIVDKWHAPDHTKIEEFRSRLSSDTQQKLANEMAKHAVTMGFADPKHVDIDSTIQEANMNYPADSCLLKKLGTMASKAAKFLNKALETCIKKPIEVNMKKISSVAREYFFLPKKAEKSTKNEKLMELLQVVKTEIAPVIKQCANVGEEFIKNIPWNYRNTILQIKESAKKYLKDVKTFLIKGRIVATKCLSFHLKEVVCFSKGKPGRKYQFGRAFQLGRIGGNFIFVEKCDDTRMNDKENLPALIKTHADIFHKKASSVGTDKGYYILKLDRLSHHKLI